MPRTPLVATLTALLALACTGLLPWTGRAVAVTEALCEAPASYEVAEAIKMATHPLATNAKMHGCTVTSEGGVVIATFQIQWNSLLGGSPFDTGIEWRFDESAHIGVNLTHDTSSGGVVPGGMDSLETALRDSIYPQIAAAVDDPELALKIGSQ